MRNGCELQQSIRLTPPIRLPSHSPSPHPHTHTSNPHPIANSSRFDLPTKTQPLSSKRWTAVAVYGDL